MNIKHTPGPWNVHGRDTRGLPHSLVAAETLIAKVYSKCYGDVEQETANAKLIAAAPDLLAAAIKVLHGLNERIDSATENRTATPVFDGIADLHDAINKATA